MSENGGSPLRSATITGLATARAMLRPFGFTRDRLAIAGRRGYWSRLLVVVTGFAGRCGAGSPYRQSSVLHSGGSAGMAERQGARHSGASQPSMT
jgi:hypothetical protein